MIAGLTTKEQLLANLQGSLANLRLAMHDAGNKVSWVTSATTADLTGLGFTDAEAATIQEVCGHVADLIIGANGGTPAPQMNYVTDALQLIGPQ
jgi:hypothetical protein